jgi:hypothetical protein
VVVRFGFDTMPTVCPVRKQVDCGSATHHNRYGFPTGVAEGIHPQIHTNKPPKDTPHNESAVFF